ncbi:ABC transporter substrate-binding protein [Phytohabitans kaempferiae]|uniref:ABC transporter substrate-binding protein n=1 Tax=Phytohabitans kaempferiae TaxID=1620943 RepID=A0ABV6M6Z5_9ACTN
MAAAALLFSALTAFTACADSGSTTQSSDSPTPANAEAARAAGIGPAVPLDGTPGFAEIVAGYAGFGTDAAPGQFPRTVTHAGGKTTLEARPTRVVTLDSAERDALLALGLMPVGVTDGVNDPPAVADVPRVGGIEAPSLDAILALKPDLILTNENRSGDIYDQLTKIAPTVMSVQTGVTWKQNFELFTAALGAEEQARRVTADYEDRAAEVAALLGDEPPTISVVRVRSEQIRLYQRSSYSGSILDGVGVPRPKESNYDANFVELSPERLQAADADIVLVAMDDSLDQAQVDEFLSQPLWKTLNAHRKGQLHQVDSTYWIAGGGYQGAFAILDDLKRILAGYPR